MTTEWPTPTRDTLLLLASFTTARLRVPLPSSPSPSVHAQPRTQLMASTTDAAPSSSSRPASPSHNGGPTAGQDHQQDHDLSIESSSPRHSHDADLIEPVTKHSTRESVQSLSHSSAYSLPAQGPPSDKELGQDADQRAAAEKQELEEKSRAMPDEPPIVRLEGQEDPQNWSDGYKWCTVAIVSCMGFISPMGSSIIVPATRFINHEWDLRSRTLALIPVSVYVLGLALGPFLFAPASELIGRKPVYVFTSLLFVLFNVGTGLVQTYAGLNILRFIAGTFGSTGPTLGSGSIGDMFSPRERGKAVSLYGLGPLLGPVVGNIIGGFVVQGDASWRWLLWTLTIMSGVISILIIFCLKETYGPVLLEKKRKRLAREAEQAQIDGAEVATLPGAPTATSCSCSCSYTASLSAARAQARRILHPSEAAKQKFRLAMTRPFRLLFTNPICAIFSLYIGFVYGEIFIFLTQHPLLFQRRNLDDDGPGPDGSGSGPFRDSSSGVGPLPPTPEGGPNLSHLPNYGWNSGESGLSYIGLGTGFLIAMALNALYNDVIYFRLVASNGRVGWFLLTKNKDQIREMFEQRDAEKALEANAESPNVPAAAPVQNKGRPEYRLPFCLLGMLILPIGLVMFGWPADAKLHWSVPLVGSLITGFATILCFQTILVYLVDAFVPFSASATACSVLMRSLLAAVFPLFAESLYASLGFGWGSTLLACVGLLGIPVPIVLFKHGAYLREKYKFTG